MSDVFFEQMSIPKPKYNLAVNNMGHGAMTGQMLEKIEKVLIQETPDWVLVYGDTNSTIAGALAAKKLHIKVAHVEAGLRSFNMSMPEEINRILTDRISDLLLCPTETAVENLNKEGFKNLDISIFKSGDVMQDAAMFYSKKEEAPNFKIPKEFVLSTIHRAENTDNDKRLSSILSGLNFIAKSTPIILPLHPRTKNIIKKGSFDINNLTIVDPVGYLEMIYLIQRSKVVMTDSGGLQKEAFFFEKPCITLRDETEWVELVEGGFNTLVGANEKLIKNAFKNQSYNMDFNFNLYGEGRACENIVEKLYSFKKQPH
jgi:UDP-GlcNAc3NAcA epimerase